MLNGENVKLFDVLVPFADFEPDIPAADLARFAKATDYEVFDVDGDQFAEVVKTAETSADFIESSSHWRERTPPKHVTIDGLPVVAWASVQVRRGDTRQPLSVVDFGNWRLSVDVDLANWWDQD